MRALKRLFSAEPDPKDNLSIEEARMERPQPTAGWFGVIAGNGPFPRSFIQSAQAHGHAVLAVCHRGETDPSIESLADEVIWIRVGQLGKLIEGFRGRSITSVAMAGGINRVNWFGGVQLDARGAALLARLRSVKDDVIMRGIAEELGKDGIEVVSCTRFLEDHLVSLGCLTKRKPTDAEWADIEVGRQALRSIGAEHIGQVVVVREGVIVAVEAVEGTDAAIRRGGELAKRDAVVVKCAKPSQDMRFDVPTVGLKTLQTMQEVDARVLALEAGRSLMMEPREMCEFADRHQLTIVGCEPLL